jgi:hypothetical protein
MPQTILGGVTIITECFSVDAGATITGVGQGYWGLGAGPAEGIMGGGLGNDGYYGTWEMSSGGGHGGAGGPDYDLNCNVVQGGKANDDPVHPASMGSGGGFNNSMMAQASSSCGGELLTVIVYDPINNTLAGPATVNGTIDMSGSPGVSYNNGADCGGGAGGAFCLEASSIVGTGLIQANGGSYLGNVGASGGGGGGGGIISLIENSTSFPGTLLVNGGIGGNVNGTTGCTPPNTNGKPGIITFTAAPANGY